MLKSILLLSLVLSTVDAQCLSGQKICSVCYSPSEFDCQNGRLVAVSNKTVCQAPLLACGKSCYSPNQYDCQNGNLVAKSNCPSPLLSCGAACYSADQYCCNNGQLIQKQFCGNNNNGGGGNNNNGGGGNNNNGGSPSSQYDLTVVNSCSFPLFVEARMGGAGAPLPGQTKTVTPLPAGSSIGYVIPATGASGTRFWAKYGCNAQGTNCLIGDQMQYYPNPPGGCPPGGCTMPIDSLFEATWGCKPGSSCASSNPTTWWDTSQVDGWTLPYKVTLSGQNDKCDCTADGKCSGISVVDATRLGVEKCPKSDNLSGSYTNVDLRYIVNGQVLGCISPCKKLNYGPPQGLGLNEGTIPTLYMCCPTPDPANCRIEKGCILPEQCRKGPIEKTQYVKAVHDNAPGVYSYSYDDLVGLHACPAGVVQYKMEFCPAGSSKYPQNA